MNTCPYCFHEIQGDHCSCGMADTINLNALPIGSRLCEDRYITGGVLGSGSFGITYKALDTQTRKVVAIKEFFPAQDVWRGSVVKSQNPLLYAQNGWQNNFVIAQTKKQEFFDACLRMFQKEAHKLYGLPNVPNIVHLLGYFEENRTAYIVMDFIEGQELFKRIERKGKIPEEILIPMMEPMLKGLQKVHNIGISHRDIKPQNIIINEQGQAVLLDFGGAKNQMDPNGTTKSVYTPGYAAPEQLLHNNADFFSDIHQLGATYYHALTGIIPERDLKNQVVPIRELAPEVSPKVAKAIMKALSYKQEDRQQSVDEFRRDLNPPETLPLNRMLVTVFALIAAVSVIFGSFGLKKEKMYIQTITALVGGKITTNIRTEEPISAEIAPKTTEKLIPTNTTSEDPAPTVMNKKTKTPIPTNTFTEKSNPTATDKPAQTPTRILSPTATSSMTPIPTNTPTVEPTPTATLDFVLTKIEQARNAKVGAIVQFGRYEQDNNISNGKEDINWIVMEKQNDKVLLLSKYGLDAQPYNTKREEVAWESCTLRSWLNNEFYNAAFSDEEKEFVLTSTDTNPDTPNYGTKHGNDTQDKLFLLSPDEANTYFASDDDRLCESTAYGKGQGVYVREGKGTSWWWLRSLGDNNVPLVSDSGLVLHNSSSIDNEDCAVRPALWLNLNESQR